MSSDPSPHLPAPVPPPGAVEMDPQSQSQPPAPPAEPPEVMHRTRAVDFLGRRTPIVYQNDNGPCPLLAICNVLLLKNVISLNPDASEVSQQKLLSLVAERLIDSNSAVQDKDEEYVRNREQNIADAIDLLPRLATGIDVNVMFRKIDDFEFTRERAIFDLLDIPLYHGWIVDPQDTETASAIGSKSYNALASGLAEFKSEKPTEENKHMEEETVDFAAATAAALKIPSPSISRGRSFDEHTLSDSAEPQIRRGDREEEEELMRVLNLSKAESVSLDTSHSHSSSNMEETTQSETFQSEAPEVVGATKKEEHGNHAVSDDVSVLSVTNGAVNGSEVLEESQEALTSKEPVDSGIQNMLPGDLDISVQSSESTPACPSHESFAPSDHQPAAPTLGEADKENFKEQFDAHIHGQSTDIEVTCDSSIVVCEAAPGDATTKLDENSGSLDSLEPLPSTIQECEPIYQGEEHILGSTNVAYENQEPVYEGEVALAEQADKSGETSDCLEDKATEHQWELIDNFLRTTANQLTVYGLFCLQEGLNERELCVFFRNNHFNTMFKYNGSLYLLATDQGFISQTDLVWQKLDEVNGDGVFLTSNFTPFKAETPRNDSWNEHQAMTSTADYIAQFDNSTSGNSYAIALQQKQPKACKNPPPPQQKLLENEYTGNSALDLHTLHPLGEKEDRPLSLPRKLYLILQPHQKRGLEWLWKLHCCNMSGGMVTDDMGLGKTLQTTIFLSGLFYSTIIERVMIVAPLSVLDAWTSELAKVGLTRRVQHYNVSGERGLQNVHEEGGILLISYKMYFINHEKLIGFPNKSWDYVVLDEAHKIKNIDAGITTAMKKIKCHKKLLLTGTRLTKSLKDIFCLMEFIKVDVLGDIHTFNKKYKNPVELGQYSDSSEGDKERCLQALACCRKKISPYMLRRTKSVIVQSGALPCKKHDVIVWLKLSDLQVNLCRTLCELYNFYLWCLAPGG